MNSKFAGACACCHEPYEIGAPVSLLPPQGKRKRWVAFHRACAERYGAERALGYARWPSANWRKHASWLTPEQFAVTELAMARRAERPDFISSPQREERRLAALMVSFAQDN